ncbi:MAG: cohesin domain-containing protein [Dehalococcoidia bacterium]
MNRLANLLLIFAAIACSALLTASALAAQEGAASITTTTEEVDRDGERVIRIDVSVENVSNLGAFQFVMNFDGEVVHPTEDNTVQIGEFLASSDREVFCPETVIDANALRYYCVTLGEEPPDGAEGSGLLASIFFTANESGSTTLDFTRAQLATPEGDPIDTTWEPGEIVIPAEDNDGGWAMWAAIGGAVVLVGVVAIAGLSLYRRRRANTGQVPLGQ